MATFDTYAGMLEAIRARVNELQVNGERLDEYVRAMPPSRRIRLNMRAVKRMPAAAGIVLT